MKQKVFFIIFEGLSLKQMNRTFWERLESNFKNLQLADFSNESNKCIDVLIGVDYYYSCILGETKRGKDSDLIAVNSHFGWIICSHYENSIDLTNLNSVHLLRANTEVLFNDYYFKEKNIFNNFKKLFNSENHGSNDVIDDVYLFIYLFIYLKNELKFNGNRRCTSRIFRGQGSNFRKGAN